MNSKTFDDLFARALELPIQKRTDFLAAECAGDEELRKKLDALLRSDAEAEDDLFLAQPAIALDAENLVEAFADSRVGTIVGRYRIVGEIGVGGMGAVYRAERADGQFEKQVALKLVKRGMDTEQILRRFVRERQILANLEHPNIARLLDAGMTSGGTPFFVMELVEGVAVDEFCRTRNLSINKKLELFRTVCLAVAHAHRNLIVHRDLKPSNILVTADGTPKLLDFGIAKLLSETEADQTQTHLRVLTPAYAAPEQSSGGAITTATDVYSLGLILAELLGVAPAALQGRSKKINTLDSPTPLADGKRRMNFLPADLQTILQTAVREEPGRRYGSAEKFADDIENFLNDLPIAARRDAILYRAGKFVKRHRLASAAAALVFLAVAGGVAATLWQWQIARLERRKAEERAVNLQNIASSFVAELHDEIVKLPGSLAARRMLLERGVGQLEQLARESATDSNLQHQLAQGYYNLGEMPDLSQAETERNRQRVVSIYRSLLETEPQNNLYRVSLANAYGRLADAQKVRGDVAAALDLSDQAIRILETVVAAEPENLEYQTALWNAYYGIAALLNYTGEGQRSVDASQKAFALAEKFARLDSNSEHYRDLVRLSRTIIAGSLTNAGDYQNALTHINTVRTEVLRQHSAEPENVMHRYSVWATHRRLGFILASDGQFAAGLQELQTALEFIEKLAAESPLDDGYRRNTSFTLLTIGQTLLRANQPAKAETYLRRALELSEKIFVEDAGKGETIADLGAIHSSLGAALTRTERRADGLRHLRESLKFYEKARASESANAVLRQNYEETLGWLAAVEADNAAPNKQSSE